MYQWGRRLASLVGALVLMAAAVYPSSAATSGNVTVTGTIVPVPVSISIGQTSIAFGNIDAKGTPQSSPAQARGYDTGDGGAHWFTNGTIGVTVSSPSAWSGTICMSGAQDLPSGQLKLATTTQFPSNESQASSYFGTALQLSNCTSPGAWVSGGTTAGTSYEYHLATFVSPNDSPREFSATITFAASNT
jgi:type 1 fimbria pilin